MRLLVAPILITLLALAIPADAAPQQVDFVITFRADGTWHYDGPTGMLTPSSEETGQRYTWDLLIPQASAVGEIRYTLDTFDLERAKQLRPSLDLGDDGFPLFHYFPRPAVWETDGAFRVYHTHFEGDTAVLRVQIPQTTDARFTLERDVTPPAYTLGEVEEMTDHSFYQQTRTTEPAIAELQVRKAESDDEWVRHPTPEFHILQNFPIKGLDPDTTYDLRALFTDWSNNTATSDLYQIHTLPVEAGAPPRFEILAPAPDSVLASGTEVTVRVRVLDGDAPLDPGDLRLFVDLQERSTSFTFEDGILSYAYPEPPVDGPHVVSVEAKTLDGAENLTRWTFHVGAPMTSEASSVMPLAWVLFAILCGVGARRLPQS